MADSAQLTPAVGWNEELFFSTLADRNRFRIFLSLARNGAQTAEAVKGQQPVSSATKHLAVMRQAGLVQLLENPRDGRKYLYALSPSVPVEKTEKGATIDFRLLHVSSVMTATMARSDGRVLLRVDRRGCEF